MDNLEIFGIPYLKKGSGIHIKKENRGKFTKYCNGKVTNECIQRGKNSSDPKIRKRAAFAANSRGWSRKHQIGGPLEYQGPTYSEVQEQWKKEDPMSYNLKQMRTGTRQGDFINYTDAEGKRQRVPAATGMSGTDPVGSLVVETIATGKPTAKIIEYIGKNLPILQKIITHPTYKKIYHGTKQKFNWNEARNFSRSNVGMHVSPNRKIAEKFAGNDGVIMEGYAPKPTRETIDIWYNNYDLLNPKYRLQARPVNSGSSYDIVLPDTKRLTMLQKAGAEPSINKAPYTTNVVLNTEKDAVLDLRSTLKLSKQAQKQADDITNMSRQLFKNKDEILNQQTANLLAKDGIKSIKYNNNNRFEVGGESWILTEPNKVWNPTWKPINIDTKFVYPVNSIYHATSN